VQAFEKLKAILASEEVMLLYPDFKKPFDLTTDASSSSFRGSPIARRAADHDDL
ncbi:Retrovirus-related Pol polyprotein from transposon gypsy, partial [Eumeta japonica]